MFADVQKILSQEQLLERYKWKRVEVPKTWYPREPGQTLVGYYHGRTTRIGAHGQYEVVLVLVPGDGAYMVSGTHILQLFDAALIDPGHPIKIVFQGTKKLDGDKTKKLFEVSVAEGDPIDASVMPTVGPL